MTDDTNKNRGRSFSASGPRRHLTQPDLNVNLPRRRALSVGETPSLGRLRASQIPAEERAKPLEFMSARAHLAAVLTGANTQELQKEVLSSQKRVDSWKNSNKHDFSKQVYDDTLAKDYVSLKRFQNEPDHFKPRSEQDLSALQQVRAMHGEGYQDPSGELESTNHVALAFIGARHTKGYNDSPFVSLTETPDLLAKSKDDGEKGAKTIALQAKQLHTYTVPRLFAWSPQRLLDTLGNPVDPGDPDGGKWHAESIDETREQTVHEWLSSTPSAEKEVLFLGGDLDKYRTASERNPNLPALKSKGRKK